jgi:uncharacterized membrane protein YdjX (TVP38/TMEM64 family)
MPSPADNPNINPAASDPAGMRLRRFVPLAVIILAAVSVYATGLHRDVSLEALVRHRVAIDAEIYTHHFLAVTAYIALYITVAALSIPGSVILTVAGGLLFGTLTGAAAAVTGATIGGTIFFLVARGAFGEWLLRCAGPQASRIVAGFRADAFSYLLFLRLAPVFPFWLVNLVAALGGVALGPFVAATAIGIIPAALVFAFFGSGVDSAITGQVAAYDVCLAAGRADCRFNFDLSAALTPHLVAALAALCLAALVPVIIRRVRAAHRSTITSK